MTNNEVNKVIAEYMGEEYCKLPDNRSAIKFKIGNSQSVLKENYYSNSLDALVPVWELLKAVSYPRFYMNENGFNCSMSVEIDRGYRDLKFCEVYDQDTIQEAAAHATAKAILELKK